VSTQSQTENENEPIYGPDPVNREWTPMDANDQTASKLAADGMDHVGASLADARCAHAVSFAQELRTKPGARSAPTHPRSFALSAGTHRVRSHSAQNENDKENENELISGIDPG
jgi:hypothetical protein